MPNSQVQTEVTFERILLATDFSPASEVALAYAGGLASQYSSALEVVNVVDLSASMPYIDVVTADAIDILRHSSEENLQRIADGFSGIKLKRKTLEGYQPASLIVGEAINESTDLIVLGTSSKHGLKKLALGSTAEEIIRESPCPTLTVGPNVQKPPYGPITFPVIVYATDFSPQAVKAAEIALSIGETYAAKIYLCHVVSEKESCHLPSDGTGYVKALEALVPEQAYDWCSPECVVEHGKPAEAIIALANRVNADLIVLGSRRSSFWVEYIETGVTPAVLAAARCPVLTVC